MLCQRYILTQFYFSRVMEQLKHFHSFIFHLFFFSFHYIDQKIGSKNTGSGTQQCWNIILFLLNKNVREEQKFDHLFLFQLDNQTNDHKFHTNLASVPPKKSVTIESGQYLNYHRNCFGVLFSMQRYDQFCTYGT